MSKWRPSNHAALEEAKLFRDVCARQSKRIEELRNENEKLRKLVDLYEYGATHDGSAAESLEWSRLMEEMCRELGIKDRLWAKDWLTRLENGYSDSRSLGTARAPR